MPGWKVQGESRGVSVEEAPHERRLQVELGGVGVEGSSLSSSRRGSGVASFGGGAIEERVSVVLFETAIGLGLGASDSG